MRAMCLDEIGSPLRLAEVSVRHPAAGELLLRVRACGVCRTDLHICDGEAFLELAPRVPLHTKVETFPLAEANAAIARVRDGRLTGAAVLIV